MRLCTVSVLAGDVLVRAGQDAALRMGAFESFHDTTKSRE